MSSFVLNSKVIKYWRSLPGFEYTINSARMPYHWKKFVNTCDPTTLQETLRSKYRGTMLQIATEPSCFRVAFQTPADYTAYLLEWS